MAANVGRYLALYRLMFVMRIKVLLAHRLDFVLGGVSTVVMQLASFGAVYLILQRTSALGGWTLSEVQLLYGVLLAALGLNQMFADNLWVVTHFARTGKLESFLTRPVNPLFHLLAERFNHVGIGDFLTGVVLTALAAVQIPELHHPLALIGLGLSVLSGSFIFFSLNALSSLAGFWLIDAVALTRAVYELHQFARYPLSVFPPLIAFVLTWIIPYGLVSARPVAGLLGKGGALPILTVVAFSTTLLVISVWLWNRSLKFYNGAGS